MSTSKIPTMLRLPEELHKKIKLLSALECRSLNMEIEYALSQYIAKYESTHGPLPSHIEDGKE